MKLVCILMAAGSASRFGANKLLQDFGGKPLCQWAMEAALSADFHKRILVTGYEAVKELAAGFEIVENNRPDLGISRTIRLGLEAAGECDGVLFLTCDQPYLSANTLRAMTAAFRADPNYIYAASHKGRRGNPVVFPAKFIPELCKLTGDTGGSQILKAHPDQLKRIEIPPEELLDCDTPEAMHELLCPLSGGCQPQG